jgi:hypothetical protein
METNYPQLNSKFTSCSTDIEKLAKGEIYQTNYSFVILIVMNELHISIH